MPSHGFITTTDRWTVVEALADRDGAWVTSRLEFYRQPMWMKQWPFAHTIEMITLISATTLIAHSQAGNQLPSQVEIGAAHAG